MKGPEECCCLIFMEFNMEANVIIMEFADFLIIKSKQIMFD